MWRALIRIIPGFRGGGHAGVAILPRQGTTGAALVIVMTIMSYLACLAVCAGVSIAAATSAWTSGIANTITVQIKPPEDGPVAPEKVQAAIAVLKRTPGIAAEHALQAKDTSRLLEPWLGTSVLGPELPLPVLIDVTLISRDLVNFDKLQRDLSIAVPGAMVDDHSRWTARLLAVSRSLTGISLTVLALVLFAATAIIVFATRAGLMAHSSIVEILHLSGAQGEFIASEFERHFSRLGWRAGVMGLVLALATLGLVYVATGSAADESSISLVPRLAMTPAAFIGLIAVPIGAAIVATLTARTTVLKALDSMP